jgi:hypothetical protein
MREISSRPPFRLPRPLCRNHPFGGVAVGGGQGGPGEQRRAEKLFPHGTHQYIPAAARRYAGTAGRLLISRRVELRNIVERFIADAAEPAVLDRGEAPLRLVPGQWELSEWSGRLTLQVWSGPQNFTRRIVGLKEQRRNRLRLVTERFPKTEAELQIADLAVPDGRGIERRISRLAFRDQFALLLARDFPQWTLAEASAEPNLEESLSPAYVRAFLKRGEQGIALMAAAPDSLDCSGVVPFGLIWLDYLRRREKRMEIRRVILYAPEGKERDAAFRVAMMDPARVEASLQSYDEKFRTGPVDAAVCGNVDSTLPKCANRAALIDPAAPKLSVEGVDRVAHSDGSVRYELNGLEFARWSGGRLLCGVGRKRQSPTGEAETLARELIRVRNADAEDRQHPLYTQKPEGWLEAQVRANPGAIDASLRDAPLYGQAPIFGGRDYGVVDLLGVDHAGRLAVIELKASMDLHLPFQALDYWLRVKKHLEAGDFERLGYFRGVTLRRESPRILLVAPALEYHSTSEMLIGYLRPEVELMRIGVAADWRREIRIAFRLRGSEKP